jgi:hypothetical protein
MKGEHSKIYSRIWSKRYAMGRVRKSVKIILGVIFFLELGFLIRTCIIYSFYKDDETYGDGLLNPSKYDHAFYSTIFISVVLMLLLMLACFLFSNTNKDKK